MDLLGKTENSALAESLDIPVSSCSVDVHTHIFCWGENPEEGYLSENTRKMWKTRLVLRISGILSEPGETYLYTIDLWATSYLLSPGDRLRVDITSSNYPRLARNLNTGARFAKTTEMKVAHQTIHLSDEYPSRIILPFIPR